MKKSTYAPLRIDVVATGAILSALLCQLGCGGSAPDVATFEAQGKVVQADGTPMSGGLIEFQSTTGPPVTTNGEIQPDGTFTLATMVEGERLPGAIPGTYRVVIMPMLSDQAEAQHIAEPIAVAQTYEVKSDGTNAFTIELPKPKRR